MTTNRKSYLLFLLALLTLAAACGPAKQEQTGEAEAPAPQLQQDYASLVWQAHNGRQWAKQKALRADVNLQFGGNTLVDGTMTMLTNTAKVRIDQRDSLKSCLIWTGETATVSPAASTQRSARFHLLTWPYFLAAPFKISDPGTFMEEQGVDSVTGKPADVARLSFASGVGDSPDDWYILYKDPKNDQLQAMAYIVTFGGQSKEKAEADPHAIRYEHYTEVDGVLIADQWTFWAWREGEGLTEQLGQASLSNIQFLEPEAGFFEVPADHRIDALPGRE